MRYALVVAVLSVGCSGSPTAPTPVPTPVSVVTPSTPTSNPPVVPPVTAAPDPVLSDPRYSASFYRMFALGVLDNPAARTLQRQTQAPRIYLRTVDDTGAAIDARTLDETAAALINTAGKLTGVFGLAGLEQGISTRQGQAGWITVRWDAVSGGNVCGRAAVGGDLITLYPKTPGCRCATGGLMRPSTVKHELGHALGFWHTDGPDDLMLASFGSCDRAPSPREVYHASVAYGRPVGSLEPR